jgi:uncharacterized FlaG/YvyC family protein
LAPARPCVPGFKFSSAKPIRGVEDSVKINPIRDAVNYLNRVHSKDEGGDAGSQQQHAGQDPQSEEDKKEAERDASPPSEEALREAMSTFQADAQTQAHGLSAEMNGNGPGLRIVLTDVSGTVVRQFTGEEFLRLREAANKDQRLRGRLLDQKF